MNRQSWGFKTAEKVSEAVIQRIEQYANGRPGLIDALYQLAVTLPGSRLTGQVSDEAVVEAAERLGLAEADGAPRVFREDETDGERRSKRQVARWLVPVISAATVACTFVYFGPTLIRISRLWPAAVGAVVHAIPGIQPETPRTPVMGLTLPRSSSPTPTVTDSDRADMPSAPAVSAAPTSNEAPRRRVRAVTRVAPARPTTPASRIEAHEEAARTPDTSASEAARASRDAADPSAVIDWLLDRSSRGR
jgi:hypothetical protein